jgi:hypothetical protein
MFTIFASVVIGHFRWYLLVIGLLWGLLILQIDRAIVTEPHYRFHEARDALLAAQDDQPARDDPKHRTDQGNQVGQADQPFDGQLTAALPGLALVDQLPAANGTGSVNGFAPAWDRSAAQPLPAALDLMKLPPDRAGWHLRGLVYLMRLLITCCIAFLVAEAAMLLIFHPEVEQQLTLIHQAQFQQERTQRIDQAISQEQGPLNTLLTNWRNAQQAVTSDKQQLTRDQDTAANEERGVKSGDSTGVEGAGKQWESDEGIVNADETTLAKAQQAAANAGTAYNNLNTELQQASQANPKALAVLNVPNMTQLQQSVYSDNGLDAQEHAFDAFVAQDHGDILVTVGPWVIRVLLISIDLVPLGTKLLNHYTLYGRRVSERALLIRYEDQVNDTARLRYLDQQATIGALHRQHDFEVEVERMGYRRTWQMGYLNPR